MNNALGGPRIQGQIIMMKINPVEFIPMVIARPAPINLAAINIS